MLIGKDWVANRQVILSRIARDVASERPGRILIVPELISHDTERRLCAAAGDTASAFAEVLSFTRLARRVAEVVGSAGMECLDEGGRIVAMAAAAKQLHSQLKAYAAVETKPEFLTGLIDAVDEFKRCCITAQDLMDASNATEGSLSQKLQELSLLLAGYDSICAQGKRDPREQMNWLLEELEVCDFAQNHTFYIDGFPDFTRQHMAVLEHLIRCSPNVTVSVNCDRVGSSRMAFEKAGQTAAELIQCAQRAGIAYEVEQVVPEADRLYPVRQWLFQGQIPERPELSDVLHLYRTNSLYDECVCAAQKIIELVQSGCRYRDIGVVCTDMAAYLNVCDMVFKRCNIPMYQAGTEDILQKTVITTVLAALDAALGGFQRADVLRYLKSALSPVDVQLCDQMENYAIVWGVQGKQWAQPWENHPEGLSGQWTDDIRQQLALLDGAREAAILPLKRLEEGFRKAKNLRQQVQALYAFLEDIHLAEHLDALARQMDAQGDNREAQILNQLWDILLDAMEQMHDMLADTLWQPDAFIRLFTLLLSQYRVGTIPPVLDAVSIGPVSAMRCQEVKHLLLLGAQEGCLPGYSGATGVLSDQERDALRLLGVPLTGGSMEGLQAEMAEIYGVFCGARQSVSVFCPAGQPSYIYQRLLRLRGSEETEDLLLGAALTDEAEAATYLAQFRAKDQAKQLHIEELYQSVLNTVSYTPGKIAEENVQKLYGEKLNLSASQIDKQAECRLAYFLHYGLRARERKEATIDPAQFGTYVHAVLEKTVRTVMQRGGFKAVTEEQTLQIAMQHAAEYAKEQFSQLDSTRIAYLFQRNDQELEMIVRELWQELHISAFTPADFEVGFGNAEKMQAIEINGKKMNGQLRGYVDRVDVWEEGKAFRVVDYKTGKKEIDYCDLFNGVGLQMLLYLFALAQNGEDVIAENTNPAGVQYFPARAPILSTDAPMDEAAAKELRAKSWKRSGLLLADDAVLEAMEPEGSEPRLCCKRKKDGSISGDVATTNQLEQLRRYIMKILGDMVDDIASGNVTPNPYTRGAAHNACNYCPFGAVCHKADVEGRRNYKMMSAQRFWDEIGRELTDNG